MLRLIFFAYEEDFTMNDQNETAQLRFLEESVIKKTGRTVDILMDDPVVPVDNTLRTLGDLYK